MDDRYLELSRGRLHVVIQGDGPAVLLLHGWPGFWFDYRHVIPLLASRARAIAPDLFGFGGSATLAGDPAAVAAEDAHARDMLELLDALGIQRAIVVGHDIGSTVGPAIARLAADRVDGLVLLNPSHPTAVARRDSPELQRESWYQQFHLLPLAGDLIDGDRPRVERYLRHFLEHWAGEHRASEAELAQIVDVYTRPGAFRASIAWYAARDARRTRGVVPPPIDLPTIALWGDSDPMRPLVLREGFERTYPRASSRVLSGVGHFVAAEAPDAVAGAIFELLERTAGR